jgi:hypothetical protein
MLARGPPTRQRTPLLRAGAHAQDQPKKVKWRQPSPRAESREFLEHRKVSHFGWSQPRSLCGTFNTALACAERAKFDADRRLSTSPSRRKSNCAVCLFFNIVIRSCGDRAGPVIDTYTRVRHREKFTPDKLVRCTLVGSDGYDLVTRPLVEIEKRVGLRVLK